MPRYSVQMDQNQPDLPRIWLLSDARNDAVLERVLALLPPRSGFIYRHYHLGPRQRRSRYAALATIARSHDHLLLLSDGPATAQNWSADGVYGSPTSIGLGGGLVRLATVHDRRELDAANLVRADAVVISPVYETKSHENAQLLGEDGFRKLAQLAEMPAIALGGMDANRAARLGCERWAAIDGLSSC